MTDQLVAYILDQLEDADKADVEARIDASPQLRQQVEILCQALEPLAADRDGVALPPGLAIRTIARVAEHLCQPQELTLAPVTIPQAPAPSRSWWGRVDVLMAACLLIAVLGLGVFGVFRLQFTAARTACADNLRKTFIGLEKYHELKKHFPNVDDENKSRKVAGMVIPILGAAGLLPDKTPLNCPGAGRHETCNLTLAQLRNLPDDQFRRQHAAHLIPSYAYCLGYRDAGDRYHPPALSADHLASQYPLLADAPSQEHPQAGNSANHGGSGQNVLFADGSVRFIVDRVLAGDDFFLNSKGKVGAGIGVTDICLGGSAASP